MFGHMIDDSKESAGSRLRLTSLAAAAVLALFVTPSFLCAAVFVAVLEKYGLVQACLAGAAVFFVVTIMAAGSYMVRKRQIEKRLEARAAAAAKSAVHSALADHVLMAAGLPVIRAIGIKKLIPILAVGRPAPGFLARRQAGAA